MKKLKTYTTNVYIARQEAFVYRIVTKYCEAKRKGCKWSVSVDFATGIHCFDTTSMKTLPVDFSYDRSSEKEAIKRAEIAIEKWESEQN